jgi:pimeloyl-ACP methyl ester carboxylesterase
VETRKPTSHANLNREPRLQVPHRLNYYIGRDGTDLSYRELGAGRPVVLLHGYTQTGEDMWIRPGIAAALAEDERRVIMPDLRAHGASARPHDPAAYPADALVDDGLALIDHLGMADGGYDLGGYSVGGRIVARMLVRGAQPGRAIVGGTGLEPIVHAAGRGDAYRRTLAEYAAGELESDPDAPWDFVAYLRSVDADPIALTLILDTFVDTPTEALAAIDVPTLVLAGEDEDRGSVDDLVATLPHATLRRVPGDHGTAHLAPEFTAAILDFLRG